MAQPETNEATFNDATAILGGEHVILPANASRYFNSLDFRFRDSMTGHRKFILDSCRTENKTKKAMWRFFPVPAASIEQAAELEKINIGPQRFEWVFTHRDDKAVMALVNFQGLHGGLNWFRQNGQPVAGVRALERYVFYGALQFWKIRGEILLPDWSHWGSAKVGSDGRACIGKMNSGTIQVSSYSQNDYADWLRICVQKNPECCQ